MFGYVFDKYALENENLTKYEEKKNVFVSVLWLMQSKHYFVIISDENFIGKCGKLFANGATPPPTM